MAREPLSGLATHNDDHMWGFRRQPLPGAGRGPPAAQLSQ